MATVADATERRDALVGRLFMDAVGAFDLFSVYIGERLGLYRALADKGPLTSTELAEAAGIHERYAREWLEQQAASEILDCGAGREARGGSASGWPRRGAARRVEPQPHRAAGPAVVASIRPIDAVLEAYAERRRGALCRLRRRICTRSKLRSRGRCSRTCSARNGSAQCRRSTSACWPTRRRGSPMSPAGRAARASRSRGPTRRCRSTESTPTPRRSRRARKNLDGSGVEDRVGFHDRDAADAGLAGRYDLVTLFEALHDMSYPVEVLERRGLARRRRGHAHRRRAHRGVLHGACGRDRAAFYGFSILHCLPVGMVGEGAAGTGTVIRAHTVKEYAEQAGFSSCEVLPIENDFWRFYLLRP